MRLPTSFRLPKAIVGKGIIPAIFVAALSGPLASSMLERWEGNVLHVYVDHLANGIPTYCAGRTDWTAPVGTQLTSDDCKEVNKSTLLEYGYAVLQCSNWDYLTANRLVALTIFSINVGKAGACNSQAIKNINLGKIAVGCKLIATRPDGKPNWSYANGAYIQGLQNRRQAESALCLT